MSDSFKLFFEARQEYIDQIQNAIDKVSDRPFNELFQGRKDRFLIKVYNPSFEQAAKTFDILDKINIKNRTIDGKNINAYLKDIKQSLNDEYRDIETKEKKLLEIVFERMDNVTKEIYSIADSLKDKGLIIKKTQDDNSKFSYTIYISNPTNILGYLYDNDLTNTSFDIKNKTNKSLTITEIYDFIKSLLERKIVLRKNRDERHLDHNVFIALASIYEQYVSHWTDGLIQSLKDKIRKFTGLKQTIDQNNIFYFLLFSRHPIDVLRMADHKGISSCHRLKGEYSKEEGEYSSCAIADAQNDGGIVYLIRGSDGKKIQENLNDEEVFYDKDRKEGRIRPIGRIRLRRFIDLETGKDFAVPTTLQSEQKYGYITHEIFENILDYTRKHQSIYNNPPEPEYARDNIVLVGGTYSDEDLHYLINNFFGKDYFENIAHKEGSMVGWVDEVAGIIENIVPTLKPQIDFTAQVIRHRYGDLAIMVRLIANLALPYNPTWNVDNFDRVLSEHIDANRVILNNLFAPKPITLMRSYSQKSVWNKGTLSSEISFNVADPQDLYPILESMIKKRKVWKSFEQIIVSDFQYKMESLAED